MGVVAFGDAHAGGLAAALVQRIAGGKGHVLKRAVSLVEVEVVRCGVVGDNEVRLAVAVDIDEERRQPIVGMLVRDAGMLTDVGKGAVAIVVKQVVGFALEPVGAAHDIHTTEGTEGEGDAGITLYRLICEVPMHVAGYEQIEAAIAVEVAPRGARGPIAERDTSLLSNIGEGAVVVVAVETVLAEVGDVEVGPAIVIEVADDRTKSPAIVGDTGLRSDVREGAVVIVVEERGMRRGGFAGLCLHRRSVDEVDVEPSVVVEIEQRDAGADAFKDVGLLRRAHLMVPGSEPGFLCDVFKDDRATLDEAAGGHGPVLVVENGGMWTTCVDARRRCRL